MVHRFGFAAAGVVALCLLLTCASRADGYGSPIDSIDLSTIFGYADTYSNSPGGGLLVIGDPATYHLHDGRAWGSGAGGIGETYSQKSSVSTSGSNITYLLDLLTGSQVYYRVDYDGGGDSSNGSLASTSQLALHAIAGSKTATLDGYARITMDEPANYNDDRFHYFNAPVDALVPFHLTYTLASGTWQTNTMDSSFTYNMNGKLDFTQALVPEPGAGCVMLSPLVLALARRRRRSRQRN
jgi:hypothetical protein